MRSLRKVVIKEVSVPVVGAPLTGSVFDRFPQSSGVTLPVSTPLRSLRPFYVSALDDHRQGRPVWCEGDVACRRCIRRVGRAALVSETS